MNVTPIEMRPQTDLRGLRSMPDAALAIGARDRRALGGGLKLRMPVPNGVHDPLTHMLIVEALLNAMPDVRFSSAELTRRLQSDFPWIIWEAITVGRVLGDIHESLSGLMSGPMLPFDRTRLADGNRWNTRPTSYGWQALVRLRVDLQKLATEDIELTAAGTRPSRLDTPLQRCASLRPVLAD